MRRLLGRVGCASSKIGTRGYDLPDFAHQHFGEMEIYNVLCANDGAGARTRSLAYARIAENVFEKTYAPDAMGPQDLIHVTCTGYASPSAAQKLVARRGWHTRVTHAYHMGCYASVPAIRMASALVRGQNQSACADIVHTEVCSLHVHPADHSIGQLVVQSLFADGHIRYSVASSADESAGLDVLATREEILPASEDAMSWMASDTGMDMTLAAEVPSHIARSVRDFTRRLCAEASIDFDEASKCAIFAVHPGGPKILDVVQIALELSDAQIAASRDVLFRYGNMSSATLPHIWATLADDRFVPTGTMIVSLAFGPGLTMCGAVMVKAGKEDKT